MRLRGKIIQAVHEKFGNATPKSKAAGNSEAETKLVLHPSLQADDTMLAHIDTRRTARQKTMLVHGLRPEKEHLDTMNRGSSKTVHQGYRRPGYTLRKKGAGIGSLGF